MPRRLRFIMVFGVVGMLVLATGISAGAAPGTSVGATEDEISAAQDRLAEIRMDVGAAQAKYSNALYNMNELNGKIALVTGGSEGFGRGTAIGLARRGATVVIVCRTRETGGAHAPGLAHHDFHADIPLHTRNVRRIFGTHR